MTDKIIQIIEHKKRNEQGEYEYVIYGLSESGAIYELDGYWILKKLPPTYEEVTK